MSPQVAWIWGLAPPAAASVSHIKGAGTRGWEELQVSWQSEWVQGAVGIGSKRRPCPRPACFLRSSGLFSASAL